MQFTMTLWLCAACAVSAAGAEFHISPTAAPGGTGAKDKPFATLVQAQDAIRALKKQGGLPKGGVTVYLHDGTFTLREPFVLTKEDSGTAEAPIVYKAFQSAKPVISGGRRITGWAVHDAAKNIYKAAAGPGLETRQLYVAGQRAVRARLETRLTRTANDTGFVLQKELADQIAQTAVDHLEVHSPASWKWFVAPVARLEGTNLIMRQPYWRNTLLHPGGRGWDWIENAYQFIDQEGEWYLDPDGTLYYKPRKGETMDTIEVIAPALETLVSGDHLEHVTFAGLTFAHATWLGPSSNDGYICMQSGAHIRGPQVDFESAQQFMEQIPGNVTFRYAKQIRIDGNVFEHLGAAGLSFGRGSCKNVIFNNTFRDISANGIVLGDCRDHHPFMRDVLRDNHIDNNLITKIGREYRDATGIQVYYTDHTVVTRNEVHDTYYTGISIGWGWGRYDPNPGPYMRGYRDPTIQRNNLVAKNLIYDTMMFLHDGGGIYSLAAHPGLRIMDNVSYGESGLYLDDGSRYVEMSGNYIRAMLTKVGPHNIHDNHKFNRFEDVPAAARQQVGRNGVLTPFPEPPNVSNPPPLLILPRPEKTVPVARWSFDTNDAALKLTGGVQLVSDHVRQGSGALRFDSARKGSATAPLATKVTDNLTFMTWVRWHQIGGCTILYNGNGSIDGYGFVMTTDHHLAICVGGKDYLSTRSYLDHTGQEWTHIAAVRRNGIWELFINGYELELIRGKTLSPEVPTGLLHISADQHFFNGDIDDVRFYEEALHPGEIWTIAQAGDGVDLAPEPLRQTVAVPADALTHWTFDKTWNDAGSAGCKLRPEKGAEFVADGAPQGSAAACFDGTTSVAVGELPALPDTNLSFSTWVKWRGPVVNKSGSVTLQQIITVRSQATTTPFTLLVDADGRIGISFPEALGTKVNYVLPVNEWTHIATIHRDGKWEMYINGHQQYLHNFEKSLPVALQGTVSIGANDATGRNGFAGCMDNTRIYGRALTRAEIVALALEDVRKK